MKVKLIITLFLAVAFATFMGCEKDEPIQTKGNITGTITEDGTNKPISAVEVTLSGKSQTYKTGSDGKFEIKDLQEGDYTITATKAGYITNKKQATVKAGQTTNLDFSLEKELPKLNVQPDLLDFGTDKEKLTFTIANDNPKTNLQWQVEKPASAIWLSLSKETGDLKAKDEVITVTVDRSKMTEAKAYTTALIVKAINGKGTKTINVTTVKQVASVSVSPMSLDFGNKEVSMSFAIKNTVPGTILNWTIEKPELATWLTLSAESGKTQKETTIKATVDRTKMPKAKVYTATLLIKTPNGDTSVVIIAGKESPKLVVNPIALDFGTDKDKLTFTIANGSAENPMDWQVEKSKTATWLSLSQTSGKGHTKGIKTITVTLDRAKLTEEKQYKTALVVSSTNGGGNATINVTAIKQGATMKVEPSALNFGTNESEKTLLVTNSTQIGSINYIASANESWITLINKEGTITKSETGSIKVSVSRLNLAAGNHNGTIVIKSNKNTVTVNVSMQVIAKQKPAVASLQTSEVKHNAIGVSAYISSVGSAAVTSYGFCWGTNPNPTTADSKNNLGGTSTNKSFNATITGLNANTQYYIRAYAINEEGTSYSDAVTTTTLPLPTMAVVRTLAVDNIKYNKANGNGTIDNLGDGYVTAYGFCYSTSNPNPTLSDQSVSLGSTTKKGNFTGEITGLTEQTKYFVRAYATNSKGTAYGSAVHFTTPIAPPLVTRGLLAYYTFDGENCNDYLGNTNHNGTVQGEEQAPTFVDDTPKGRGKAVKMYGEGYYLLATPDKTSPGATYSVWVKSKAGNGSIYVANNNTSWGRSITFSQNKIYIRTGYYENKVSANSTKFSIDLSSIIFDGNWHHIIVTFTKNPYRAVAKLYVDSRLYEKLDNFYNYDDYRQSQARIGYKFTGTMDNLRIYNRALGQEEIKTIYNAKQ